MLNWLSDIYYRLTYKPTFKKGKTIEIDEFDPFISQVYPVKFLDESIDTKVTAQTVTAVRQTYGEPEIWDDWPPLFTERGVENPENENDIWLLIRARVDVIAGPNYDAHFLTNYYEWYQIVTDHSKTPTDFKVTEDEMDNMIPCSPVGRASGC